MGLGGLNIDKIDENLVKDILIEYKRGKNIMRYLSYTSTISYSFQNLTYK